MDPDFFPKNPGGFCESLKYPVSRISPFHLANFHQKNRGMEAFPLKNPLKNPFHPQGGPPIPVKWSYGTPISRMEALGGMGVRFSLGRGRLVELLVFGASCPPKHPFHPGDFKHVFKTFTLKLGIFAPFFLWLKGADFF